MSIYTLAFVAVSSLDSICISFRFLVRPRAARTWNIKRNCGNSDGDGVSLQPRLSARAKQWGFVQSAYVAAERALPMSRLPTWCSVIFRFAKEPLWRLARMRDFVPGVSHSRYIPGKWTDSTSVPRCSWGRSRVFSDVKNRGKCKAPARPRVFVFHEFTLRGELYG